MNPIIKTITINVMESIATLDHTSIFLVIHRLKIVQATVKARANKANPILKRIFEKIKFRVNISTKVSIDVNTATYIPYIGRNMTFIAILNTAETNTINELSFVFAIAVITVEYKRDKLDAKTPIISIGT